VPPDPGHPFDVWGADTWGELPAMHEWPKHEWPDEFDDPVPRPPPTESWTRRPARAPVRTTLRPFPIPDVPQRPVHFPTRPVAEPQPSGGGGFAWWADHATTRPAPEPNVHRTLVPFPTADLRLESRDWQQAEPEPEPEGRAQWFLTGGGSGQGGELFPSVVSD